jgi:hypothetical protein
MSILCEHVGRRGSNLQLLKYNYITFCRFQLLLQADLRQKMFDITEFAKKFPNLRDATWSNMQQSVYL